MIILFHAFDNFKLINNTPFASPLHNIKRAETRPNICHYTQSSS